MESGLGKKLSEIGNLLKAYYKVQTCFNDSNKVTESMSFGAEFKKNRIAKRTDELNVLCFGVKDKISEMIPELAALAETEVNVSFLGNAEFTNVLKTIEACKGNVPTEVMQKLNEKFKDDLLALKTLRNIYSENHCNEACMDIDDLIAGITKDSTTIQRIDDKVYFYLGEKDTTTLGIIEELEKLANFYKVPFDSDMNSYEHSKAFENCYDFDSAVVLFNRYYA